MRRVVLASLRAHARRYVATGLAVLIGVAFVVVTGAITGATRAGLSQGVGAPYAGADVVATGVTGGDLDAVHEAADEQGATISVVGWTTTRARADGVPAEEVYVGEMPTLTPAGGDAPTWPRLVDGRGPAADGEAVVDERTAEVSGLEVGDVVTLGEDRQQVEVTVVGVADPGPTSAANALFLRWEDLRGLGDVDDLLVEAVAWHGPGSVADQEAQLGGALAAAGVDGGAGVEVVDADSYVDELVVEANNGVDVLATMLMLFAAVALLVATMVITNTFAILLAQRRREMALLRCVGASRAQLRRAVRLEALGVGVTATALGLVAGAGLGRLVVAVVRDRVPGAGLAAVGATWPWYAAAAAVGVLVTLTAAWLPTRRAVRVAPVAALRPEEGTRHGQRAGRVRLGAGLAAVAGGSAMLGVAVATESVAVMVAGGSVAFGGVLLLGPVVVPGLVRMAGALAGRVLGPTVRLAADDAVRDPRRTAAASASLLVGVTLTTAVLVGVASATAVTDEEMARQHPVDAALTAPGRLLPGEAGPRLGDLEGVERAAAVPGTVARVADVGEVTLVAPDAVDDPDGLDGLALDAAAAGEVADDEIRLPPSAFADGLRVDRPLAVAVGDDVVRLRPTTDGGEVGEVGVVSPAVLARLDPDPGTGAVWLRAEDDVAGEDLAAEAGTVAASYGGELTVGLANRDYVALQLSVVTASVVGLLGIAVLIALAGIANTLGLSVLERTRELALLRALGLSRRGLRSMLAAEGTLLALVATALGTAVGVVFAWVGVATMITPVVGASGFVVPWGQLVLVLLVAAGSGLLAAALPARRAARIAPAAGLTVE